MRKYLSVVLSVLLAAALLPMGVFAADSTLTVGPGGYATVQAAVNAAGTGNVTVRISAGTYVENVTVTQKANLNLVLEGEAGTVFTGTLTVDGAGRTQGTETLTVRNIRFDHSAKATPVPAVVTLQRNAHNVTFENCVFAGKKGAATVGIRAGTTGVGNIAYKIVIRACRFDGLNTAVEARSYGLTVQNVTMTNVEAGIEAYAGNGITLQNVDIAAARYALRLGENNSSTNDFGVVNIRNSRLAAASKDNECGAIVLRKNARVTLKISASDILGNVYNASTKQVYLEADDVYWGPGFSLKNFRPDQKCIVNNAGEPHGDPNPPDDEEEDDEDEEQEPETGDTEVLARADVAYTVIIPPVVDFGTIHRRMEKQIREFTVTVEEALLEDHSRVTVRNVTENMVMRDKNGTGRKTLAFALEQPDGLFSFAQEVLEDGEESITSAVTCEPTQLKAAGAYKGFMNFEIRYEVVAE